MVVCEGCIFLTVAGKEGGRARGIGDYEKWRRSFFLICTQNEIHICRQAADQG